MFGWNGFRQVQELWGQLVLWPPAGFNWLRSKPPISWMDTAWGQLVTWLESALGWLDGQPPIPWLGRHRRQLLWLAVGVAALCFVMLKDVSGLLGDVEGSGSRSYNASVLTSFKINPTDVSDLRGAVGLWNCVDHPGIGDCPARITAPIGQNSHPISVRHLLKWHFGVDLLFVPAYCFLLGAVLALVGVPRKFWLTAAIAIALVDWAETALTWFVIRDLNASKGSLMAIQCLSFAKWFALTTALIPLPVWLVRPKDGWSAQKGVAGIVQARGGGVEHPLIALAGLIILVLLFAGFVAFPAGGALDQIPDVLRYQMSRASFWSFWRSCAALIALAFAVVVAGLLATDDESVPRTTRQLPSYLVLGIAGGISVTLFFLVWHLDDEASWRPWAFLIVFGTLWLASFVAKWADVSPKGDPTPPEVDADQPSVESLSQQNALWVGGLAGVVLMAGGLALVRAAFPPLLTDLPDHGFPRSWRFGMGAGAATTLLAGVMTQWFVAQIQGLRRVPWTRRAWWAAACGFGLIVCSIVVWLTYDPHRAYLFGVTGVVSVSLAFFALLLGLLSWGSRRTSWLPTWRLGFGARTPWLLLLAVTWVIASLLNTKGGYHDARVYEGFSAPNPSHTSLASAFKSWVAVQESDSVKSCRPAGEPIPMVFVAAPGGGMKAAFWTNRALDALFAEGKCAAPRLFAISGVSGGALGATTWMAAAAAHESSEPAITSMSGDRALSAAIAGLLLRDLPQPLTGITTKWRDRAALLEDGWIDSAHGVLGSRERPLLWDCGTILTSDACVEASKSRGDEFATPASTASGWTPVLVLNGSSVNDGCRILIANVGLQPASQTGDNCYAVPGPGRAADGPVSGSLDPFQDCQLPPKPNDPQRQNGMRAATAALLSARFPIVSPTGALHRCLPGRSSDKAVSYAVDGGYFENSGLLTLLQMWSALEPSVRAECKADGTGLCIEPWFVVLDNHYLSNADVPPSSRTYEVVAPLTATNNKEALLSDVGLEQVAAWESAVGFNRCTNSMIANISSKSDAPASDGLHASSPDCSGFVRLGPTLRPAVAAPLGWVLSRTSRDNLCDQLQSALASTDPNLRMLRDRLSANVAEMPANCPPDSGAAP